MHTDRKEFTEAMVDWARRTEQYYLVTDGYIATRSRHNGGSGAIDCSLYDPRTKLIVRYGYRSGIPLMNKVTFKMQRVRRKPTVNYYIII